MHCKPPAAGQWLRWARRPRAAAAAGHGAPSALPSALIWSAHRQLFLGLLLQPGGASAGRPARRRRFREAFCCAGSPHRAASCSGISRSLAGSLSGGQGDGPLGGGHPRLWLAAERARWVRQQLRVSISTTADPAVAAGCTAHPPPPSAVLPPLVQPRLGSRTPIRSRSLSSFTPLVRH